MVFAFVVSLLAWAETAAGDGQTMRVFELRRADANYVAALLGGGRSVADPDEVTRQWAADVVGRALDVLPPPERAERYRPRWLAYADILPADPPDQQSAAAAFARVLDIPELSQPPVALPGRNALLARGTPDALDRLAEIIAFLDKPVPMVNVEVTVKDTPVQVVEGWGIDFHVWNGDVEAASVSNVPGDAATLLRWGRGRADLLLGFEDRVSRARTETGINVTTTSGLPAEVGFGQVLPFFVARVWYDYFGRRHVEYEPDAVFIGLQLWVLPTVLGNDVVRMVLRPTFSYGAGFVASPRGEVIPIVRYQSVATTVDVPDGETMLVGGLRNLRDEAHQRFAGLLHDVRVYDSSNPMMFVTPRILRPEGPQ
ncbi:MAG: hypothetical protein N2512_09925 [Armatimonadetes bacterium]|nr:hypothetical protein [Armatimonadota bacterium]